MKEFIWREILQEIEFKSEWSTFSSHYKAEKWCKENWYLTWSMQRSAPIAICKWEEWYVSKWRNLWDDIEKIDGVIIPDPDFREWNAKIYILWNKIRPREDLKQYDQHISDPFKSTVAIAEWREKPEEVKTYDFSESDERIRWLADEWELWEELARWSSRICFQHKKNPDMIIKVPIAWKEYDADWQSEEEFVQYTERQKLFAIAPEMKASRIAPCIWLREKKILYMMKVDPIPWAWNLWMWKDGFAYQFDIF